MQRRLKDGIIDIDSSIQAKSLGQAQYIINRILRSREIISLGRALERIHGILSNSFNSIEFCKFLEICAHCSDPTNGEYSLYLQILAIMPLLDKSVFLAIIKKLDAKDSEGATQLWEKEVRGRMKRAHFKQLVSVIKTGDKEIIEDIMVNS